MIIEFRGPLTNKFVDSPYNIVGLEVCNIVLLNYFQVTSTYYIQYSRINPQIASLLIQYEQ